MSTTVRVGNETRARVAALAAASGRQIQEVIAEAVDRSEKSLFWDGFTSSYDRLSADPQAWSEMVAERRLEAGVLPDGLDPE